MLGYVSAYLLNPSRGRNMKLHVCVVSILVVFLTLSQVTNGLFFGGGRRNYCSSHNQCYSGLCRRHDNIFCGIGSKINVVIKDIIFCGNLANPFQILLEEFLAAETDDNVIV